MFKIVVTEPIRLIGKRSNSLDKDLTLPFVPYPGLTLFINDNDVELIVEKVSYDVDKKVFEVVLPYLEFKEEGDYELHIKQRVEIGFKLYD